MNSQEQLLQDKSFFNTRSLIYRTICWTVIFCFTWQQLAQGATSSYFSKPSSPIPQEQPIKLTSDIDKEKVIDKVKSLVNEGVDLSTLNNQEEKYITKRGYSAIETIKQMREENETLRKKQMIEYQRQYQNYAVDQTQKQNLFFTKYDSYVAYQDLTRVMRYAFDMAYKANVSYLKYDDGKVVYFQRGLVRAVLNEKIVLPGGEVVYKDTINMIYNDQALLTEYTVITHQGQTNFNLYNMGPFEWNFDPEKMVEQYGYITEEHHYLTWKEGSRFYASSEPGEETNAVKQIESHWYTTRTYGNAPANWNVPEGATSVTDPDSVLIDETTGLVIAYTENVYDENNNLIARVEHSDMIYDEDGNLIMEYQKVFQVNADGTEQLVQQGTLYYTDTTIGDDAYQVITTVDEVTGIVTDIYKNVEGKEVYRITSDYHGKTFDTLAAGDMIDQKKETATAWDANGNATAWRIEYEGDFTVISNVNGELIAKDTTVTIDDKVVELTITEKRILDEGIWELNLKTEAIYYPDGSLKTVTTTYDDCGRVIKRVTENILADGSTTITEQQYGYFENTTQIKRYYYKQDKLSATGDLIDRVETIRDYEIINGERKRDTLLPEDCKENRRHLNNRKDLFI